MSSNYKHHRRIVEKRIGRKLRSDEIIHHKNHNKEDNREENLEIVSQEEHNIELFKGKDALYKFRKKYQREI